MPIRLPRELAFRTPGPNLALEPGAQEEFLALARRINGPGSHKHTLETFKRHFCRASGESYYSSSTEDWAGTDLWRAASTAADNGPEFVAAFCNACEDLESEGAIVPGHPLINAILERWGCSYHVLGDTLIGNMPHVPPPESPLGPAEAVSKALSDAVALVGQSGAASGIDRAHTALHGYLIRLCEEARVNPTSDATTTQLFKLLRRSHPALDSKGSRANDINKILQSLASVLDALAPIRNKASLAHPNVLLEEPEAMVALNAIRTLFRYLQDSIRRYTNAT